MKYTIISKMRRGLVLCLLCMLIMPVKSQNQNPLVMNPILNHMDQIPVSVYPTGILINRTFSFIDYEYFKGSTQDSVCKTSDVLQALLEFRNVGNHVLNIPHDTIIKKEIAFYDHQGLVPIGGTLVKYNEIDFSGPDSNFFEWDTVTDRIILLQGSYVAPQYTTILTASMYPVLGSGEDMFILPRSLFFTNYIGEISVAYAIEGQETFTPLTWDQPFRIDLGNTNGPIAPKVILKFSIGIDEFISKFGLIKRPVIENPDLVLSVNNLLFPACLLNQMDFAPSEAQVKIMYSTKPIQGLRKPLIFVEGYDPDGNPYDSRFGQIDWNTYKTGVTFNDKGEMIYEQLLQLPLLMNTFLAEGYDIIIVDFKDPGQRIESHAYALTKVIQWVNQSKITSEESIIMGASMGGLIVRYALKYMEDKQCQHCCKAYFSLDAPHRGANIPTGVQEAVRFFYEVKQSAREEYLYKLNTVAAKQMLYTHVGDGAPALRTEWQSKIDTMGQPAHLERFALSSGSKSGATLPFIQPGSDLLHWKIEKTILWKKSPIVLCHVKSYHPNNFIFKGIIDDGNVYETTVNGNGQYILDNVPGGMGTSTKDVLEELKKVHTKTMGSITRFQRQFISVSYPIGQESHSFVPVTSSIDLPNSNFIQDFNNIDLTQITPFRNLYLPASNQFHLLINQDNIEWLKSTLQMTGSNPESTLPSVTNGPIFNYGVNTFASIPSINVQNGGILGFNMERKSKYGKVDDIFFNQIHNVWGTSNCNTIVNIYHSGQIVLGEQGPNVNRRATVIFRPGSVLNIENDGVLRIADGSTLIIEEGATLNYNPGAKIYLEGPAAVLEIRGKLVVNGNAVFSISKGNASQIGFIRFRLKDNATQNLFPAGNLSQFHISGNSNNDKIIEIAGGTNLKPGSVSTTSNYFSLFRIENGIVEYTDGGSIDLSGSAVLTNVKFKSIVPKKGKALVTSGQANLQIHQCFFENFKKGIEANNYIYSNPFAGQNLTFFNCDYGLHSKGINVNLLLCKFSNCYMGLWLDNSIAKNIIRETKFIYSVHGVFTEFTNQHIYFDAAWFLNNTYGIHDMNHTDITLSCTPFERCTHGVFSNGRVNMSNYIVFPGVTQVGGKNSFFLNDYSIVMNMGQLYLQNGNNNFIKGTPGLPYNFITGGLLSSPAYIPSMSLDLSNNYWSPAPPANMISNGNGSHYSLVAFNGTGIHLGPVNASGNSLNSMYPVCFSFPRFYPDYKAPLHFQTDTVALEENDPAFGKISYYPNPAQTHISLEINAATEQVALVEILDLNGKVLITENHSLISGNNTFRMELGNIMPGLYLIKVTTATSSETFKFLKIK